MVERVFLLVHIGFVGVHSDKVSRGAFWYQWGGGCTLGWVYFSIWRVVVWYKTGGFLVPSGGFFGRHHPEKVVVMQPY